MPSPIMQRSYSKRPLKKRPIQFSFEDEDIIDCETRDEPENLCIKKKEYLSPISDNSFSAEKLSISSKASNMECASSNSQSSSVIVPTPTYPKLNLQPWTFPLPYSGTDFYRNLHHQPISPLRSDLHSPTSSPSEGSISPPPQYLQGRSSSVSPPIRSELYGTIGLNSRNSHIIKPEVINHSQQHRFIPYPMPPYQPYVAAAAALGMNHHLPSQHHHHQPPPVSPTYSDSSFYSMRSTSPESNWSIPEDLSVKNPPSSTCSSISSADSVNSSSDRESTSDNLKSYGECKDKMSPPRYQCPDCNKSYSTFSGLTKHQQFHCPAAEGNQVKKSFSCKDCDKTYVSLGALKMHIRTHTLPCKCTICGKAFSRPWLLQGHIRTHTGEKPFSCQHCHRAFADRSNLRAHLQTHSDIKKYSCTTCSKTFSRMSLLTKHCEGGCPGTQIVNSMPSYISSFSDVKDIPAY